MRTVLLIFVFAAVAGATCTAPCVQVTSTVNGSTTSLPLAYGSNVVAKNLLIAATIGPVTTSISDTQSNVWTKYHPFVGQGFDFWWAVARASAAVTVTVSTNASASYMSIGIAEFSSATVNTRVDQTAAQTGAGAATWNSGNATTIANGEIIIGYGGSDGGGAITAGAGYTFMQDIDGSTWEYQVQSSKGSINAGFGTASPPPNYYAYMVTFWNPVPGQFARSN